MQKMSYNQSNQNQASRKLDFFLDGFVFVSLLLFDCLTRHKNIA